MATDSDFRDGLGSAFGGGDSAFDVYASVQHGYSLPLSCCDTAPPIARLPDLFKSKLAGGSLEVGSE